jgi:signal transduction histidine kinase
MILSDEKRLEYLNTLEKKALRLKVLIEDLFEVSKAASKNVTLNIVDVDIYNLVKQVALEMSDKFKQANLDLRLNFPEEKLILPLDSQKTYRIYENLFGNIAKYALTGTRVYVNAIKTPSGVSITLKNITEQEIAVTPEELTDRFVRGDAARNTEGSGLGLSIAKSFMELQGGKLVIEIDGDLFKVITTWENRKLEISD